MAGKEDSGKKAVALPKKKPEAGKKAKKGARNERERLNAFLEKNSYYLAAVAAIAVVALALFFATLPEQAKPEDFWGQGGSQDAGQLKMIIVTSNRCPQCEASNSLEVLFNANGISYSVNKFEESTADGKGFVEATGVKSLPAFLIDEKSISDQMVVKTASGYAPLEDTLHFYVNNGYGTYEDGIFVFPEMELDSVIRAKILLGESCGSEDQFSIQLFADPYDPNTIKRSKDFENLRMLLEAEPTISVSLGYNYLPTYSRVMEEQYLKLFGGKRETVRGNLEGPAKYLVCANDVFGTEKFVLLQRAIYSTYCEIDENTIASQEIRPLAQCSDSNHFNVFLTTDELTEAAGKAGVADMAFNACYYSVDEKLAAMQALARAAGIERTPTVLVNCQYVVPLDKTLVAVCQINKDLPFCLNSNVPAE